MQCPTCGRQHTTRIGHDDFTPREKEVIRLVFKGLTNKKIGETLFVETKTIKFHMTKIFRKAGVLNRYQLIAKQKDLINKLDIRA